MVLFCGDLVIGWYGSQWHPKPGIGSTFWEALGVADGSGELVLGVLSIS